MSLQDLTNDISILTAKQEGAAADFTKQNNQTCNKTVDCSCGCEEDEMFAHVNRTQQDYKNMQKIKKQKEFLTQINTEIISCTQDGTEDD